MADVPWRTGCDDPYMTQLTNPTTHNHPNLDRAQAALDASRQGDYGPTFEALADEIILETAPEQARGASHAARRIWACCSLSSLRPSAARSDRKVGACTPTTA